MKPEIETVAENLNNQKRKILELALVAGESEENSLELSLRIWKDGTLSAEIVQKGNTDGLSEEDRIEYRIPCQNLYNFVDVDDETDEDEYRKVALSSFEYQEKINSNLSKVYVKNPKKYYTEYDTNYLTINMIKNDLFFVIMIWNN